MRIGWFAAFWVLASCAPEFTPQSEVTTTRVLGIRAEPPDLGFDASTTLTAVVSFPQTVQEATWTACPLSLGAAALYTCAVPELPVAGTGLEAVFDGATLLPYLDTLDAFFPQFVGFLKQVIEQKDTCLSDMLQAWESCQETRDAATCDHEGAASTRACLRRDGLDVSFHLVVRLSDGRTLNAYKRALFRDPAPDRPYNRNPHLTGILLGKTAHGEGASLAVFPGQKLDLLPVLASDAVEKTTDFEGKPTDEVLFYTWYATTGRFAHIRSTLDWPDNRLTLPDKDVPADATVWLFVHDDRLGQDFLSFTLKFPQASLDTAMDAAGGEP